jgi:hypothetical protein
MIASALLLLAACTKPSGSDGSASTTTSSSVASTSPSGASSTATSASAAASGPVAWSGNYQSAPGSFYYPGDADVPNPDEWKNLKWQGDDASVGLGDGTMTIAIDAKNQVTGTADGAIGNAVITGVVADGRLTARVSRKDPMDRGLTGTAIGKVSGDAIEGQMKLSASEAQVLRTATFKLAKKP